MVNSITTEDLREYIQSGVPVITAHAVGRPRILGPDMSLTERALDALISRGFCQPSAVREEQNGIFVSFGRNSSGFKLLGKAAKTKNPLQALISITGQKGLDFLIKQENLNDIVSEAIEFLSQDDIVYRTDEELIREYQKPEYFAEFHTAVGTTLLAMAFGNTIAEKYPSSADARKFRANERQIALGTMLTPIAKRKIAEKGNTARPAYEAAEFLRRHYGIRPPATTIVMCSDNGYTPEELQKKFVGVKAALFAKSAYGAEKTAA